MTISALWERVSSAFRHAGVDVAVPLLAVALVLAAAGTSTALTTQRAVPDELARTVVEAHPPGAAAIEPEPVDPAAPAVQPAAEVQPAEQESVPAPELQEEAEAEPDDGRIPLVPAEPHLAAYAGLSTWIDLYDIEISPEEQVAISAREGVEAIYTQTARFNSPADIHDPDRLGRLIDAAHDHGIKVMVWYIPDFVDLDRDFRRSIAAMRFVSPRGNRADSFGLDIEYEAVRDVAARSKRLLTLSAALRDWAGPDYPMSAIVLPPLQLEMTPGWWPAFPWAELRPYYDVFVPMSYSSFRGTDPDTTYAWNLENVVRMRALTGDLDLPVHLAGGIADNLPHVDAFVRAAADADVLGAGLYDLDTTPDSAWEHLRGLRSAPMP